MVQFAALLPYRPPYDPSHPLGCHRPRIADRIIFEKLIQVLRFGCSYASIADCTCGATTIRDRRNEWIRAGIFADLKTIARESYDRIAGLALADIAVDGCITKAPGGRGRTGDMARKGAKAPIQAGQRWHVERTNAWHNNFNRLQRCGSATRKSSTPSSTSPTPSLPSAGSSASLGPSTGGTAARQNDH